MANFLRVLVVEDSEADTGLLLAELRRGGYEVEHERVETRPAMQAALAGGAWDLILCDYSLPRFSAIEALETLKESGQDLPFIIVSGAVGEETAVAALKAGAHDFVLKNRTARLIPAIERELRDARTRRLHRQAEAERMELVARLESINAEIERFTYTAFHDLRSPLVTIKGFLAMLEKDLAAGRQEHVRKDMQRITGAANRMDALLTDLLELFRVGRVVRPPQAVDLREQTRAALFNLDSLLRESKAVVRVAPDLPTVQGDPTRLRELMEILIENGIKHGAADGPARVDVGARQQDGQYVIFVQDRGRGIEPRYHNRIFNLFERLDPTAEGTGIGLTLAKRIVEVHGGKIWVESEGKGDGSTFLFSLPVG